MGLGMGSDPSVGRYEILAPESNYKFVLEYISIVWAISNNIPVVVDNTLNVRVTLDCS